MRAALLALALAVTLAAGGPAGAAMEVSVDREIARLEAMRQAIEAMPAFAEAEALKARIDMLRQALDEVELSGDPGRQEELRHELDRLSQELAERLRELDEARQRLGLEAGGQRFAGVRHRLAAFTFDDPDDTGLGDPISVLLSRELLFGAPVSSYAVVTYREGTARAEPGALAYFDKVDALVADQDYLAAIWGRVFRSAAAVEVETFLQVPDAATGEPFRTTVRLPEAMGSGVLTARLTPSRVLVQRLALDEAGVAEIRDAAAGTMLLRAAPDETAPVVGEFTGAYGGVFRITAGRGDWVEVRYDDGPSGWTSVAAFCRGACRQLMAGARYANAFVATAATGRDSSLSDGDLLTPEARGMLRQLAALERMEEAPAAAAELLGRTEDVPAASVNAGLVNLSALAAIATALEAVPGPYERKVLPDETLRPLVARLAAASVADPANIELVDNLAVLYGVLRDEGRQTLARTIGRDLRAALSAN